MSIHTILSQEIVSDKTNRLYVRSKKYPNGGLIMGIEVDKFLKHLATRIVEEVGSELIGELEKHHEKSMCTGCGEDLACDYEEVYEIMRTKLQKMKEI